MTSNRDLPPMSATSRSDRGEAESTVSSIAEDFAALVQVIDRQLKFAASPDDETRSHLLRAREAAERGIRLSRELMERAQAAK